MTRAEKAELIKKITEEANARQTQTTVEAPKAEVKTFEVDGEQVPYEAPKPKTVDRSISSAWTAIAKAGRW